MADDLGNFNYDPGLDAGMGVYDSTGFDPGSSGGGFLSGVGNLFSGNIGTGMSLAALGSLLGTYANQQGIKEASNLINQYGGQALQGLNATIGGQQALQQGTKGDLYNIGLYGQQQLQNTLAGQQDVFNQTNQNLQNVAKNQQNLLGNIYGQQQGYAQNTLNNLYGNYANAQNLMGNVYGQQLGFQSPYQITGRTGAEAILQQMPYLQHQFSAADLNSQLAPNYQFMLQQGQMANQRAANALGGGFGGNALQGLNKFTQDYAGNAYQNAFQNYQAQRQNIYNNLASIAGIGTTSAGQLAGLGSAYGGNIGTLSSNLGGNVVSNTGQLQNAATAYGGNTSNVANTLAGNLLGSAGQMQNAYSNYNQNLANLANTLSGNVTSGANALMGAGTQYGTNLANLATGLGSAQAQNAVASAQANAGALQSIGNNAMLAAILNSRPQAASGGGGGGGGGNILNSIASIAGSFF